MNHTMMKRILKVGDPITVTQRGGGGRTRRCEAKILSMERAAAHVRFLESGEETTVFFKDIEISDEIAARAAPIVERKRAPRGSLRLVALDEGPADHTDEQNEEPEPEREDEMQGEPPIQPHEPPAAAVTAAVPAPAPLPVAAPVRASSLAAWIEMGREVAAELDRDITTIEAEQNLLRLQREAIEARERSLEQEHTRLVMAKRDVSGIVSR